MQTTDPVLSPDRHSTWVIPIVKGSSSVRAQRRASPRSPINGKNASAACPRMMESLGRQILMPGLSRSCKKWPLTTTRPKITGVQWRTAKPLPSSKSATPSKSPPPPKPFRSPSSVNVSLTKSKRSYGPTSSAASTTPNSTPMTKRYRSSSRSTASALPKQPAGSSKATAPSPTSPPKPP